MTIEDALAGLALELEPLNADDLLILEATLTRLANHSYNEGWADGMAEGVDDYNGDDY